MINSAGNEVQPPGVLRALRAGCDMLCSQASMIVMFQRLCFVSHFEEPVATRNLKQTSIAGLRRLSSPQWGTRTPHTLISWIRSQRTTAGMEVSRVMFAGKLRAASRGSH